MLTSALDRAVPDLRSTTAEHPRGLPTIVFRDEPGTQGVFGAAPPAQALLTSPDGVADAAAGVDVVRVAFSPQIPTLAAAAELIASLAAEMAARGRDRRAVTVLLDVDVRVQPDEGRARATRNRLADLDAMAGIAWSPRLTRVVGVGPQVVEDAVLLASCAGADGVVLVPLSPASDLGKLQAMAAARG